MVFARKNHMKGAGGARTKRETRKEQKEKNLNSKRNFLQCQQFFTFFSIIMYIVFEGIVGSGKTTQAKQLGAFLAKRFREKEVRVVREP